MTDANLPVVPHQGNRDAGIIGARAAGLASSLAVRLLLLRYDPRVTAPSPAVLVCCNCGALEDPREGEVSALTPSLPI